MYHTALFIRGLVGDCNRVRVVLQKAVPAAAGAEIAKGRRVAPGQLDALASTSMSPRTVPATPGGSFNALKARDDFRLQVPPAVSLLLVCR